MKLIKELKMYLLSRMKLSQGFTLVELMVVVAIIGILSAIAVPNFKKYQAKAKTSEAKLQLAALYTAEQSFYSDFSSYASCLNIMGYDPTKEYTNRYYAVGFAGVGAGNTAAVSGGAPTACTTSAAVNNTATAPSSAGYTYAYGAGKSIEGATAMAGVNINGQSSTSVTTAASFTAAAIGIISGDSKTDTTADIWTINLNKTLTNARVGY